MEEARYIRTVTGKFDPFEISNEKATTLPYEHLIQNLCSYVVKEIFNDITDQIELKSLYKLHLKPFSTYANLCLEADANKVANELRNIKDSYSCALICDMTTTSNGRNLKCLREISKYTGILICHGLSLNYSFQDLPLYINDIKYELLYGFEDQIPSFIGEVLISEQFPIEQERELFQALVALIDEYQIPIFLKLNGAQRRNATNTLLPYLNSKQIENRAKWVISLSLGDMDNYEDDKMIITEIVKSGYSLVLCTFDCDVAQPKRRIDQYYNKEKALFLNKTLLELRELIHLIMISNNINFKIQLKEYGGFGYDNIFMSYMDDILLGLTQEEKQKVVKANLISLLSWWKAPLKSMKAIPLVKCEECGKEKEETNSDIIRKGEKSFCNLACLKQYLSKKK